MKLATTDKMIQELRDAIYNEQMMPCPDEAYLESLYRKLERLTA